MSLRSYLDVLERDIEPRFLCIVSLSGSLALHFTDNFYWLINLRSCIAHIA